MLKFAAVIVICAPSFLDCLELPFIEEIHTFNTKKECETFLKSRMARERKYRLYVNDRYREVMGQCVLWSDETDLRR